MRKKRVKALRKIIAALQPGKNALPEHVKRKGYARIKGVMTPVDQVPHGAYWWRQIKKAYKQGDITYENNTTRSD